MTLTDTSDHPRVASEAMPLIPVEAPKRPKTPLPKLQIGILMILEMARAISLVFIYPYINQFIGELPAIRGDAAAVGYYVGIIESLYFVTRALTLLKWCRLSDRIGRKPVMLFALSGTCISVLCFGLSTTLWSLAMSRCMWGALDGSAGVMKTVMGELTDSTNMAQGFALFPIFWYIGSSVGSLMGGTLARPQDHWPGLFAGPFWKKHQYFLPSAASAFVLLLSFFLLLFFFKETLSTKRRRKLTSTTFGDADTDEREALVQQSESTANMPLRSLLTPTVVIPIANYTIMALLEGCLTALLPLFLSTPISLGGLGLTPSSIGSWLALCGVANGVIQALLLAKIVDWFGPKRVFCVSVSCFVPVMVMFPIMSWLVRTRGLVDHAILFTLIGQLVLILTWNMANVAALMFVTASAPANNVLGAVNGLSQTSVSIARAIGPTLATSLFAFSKDNNVLNGNAVYVILIIVAGALRWLASKLPDEIQDRDEWKVGTSKHVRR